MNAGDYVPFDKDWWAIGFMEPEFVTEIVGWANEELLLDAGMLPVGVIGADHAVAWVPDTFTRKPLPEPKPITRTTLKWRWVGM